MALQLGLVGLPNVGKSTLFNALTLAGATVASYPFTTIEPNIGVVAVPDARLDRIGAIIAPIRLVPATLRVVDIAGLVKGASQGEGLGNQFLSHIRGVDATAMVVRCFEEEDIPHVAGSLGPIRDIETIELELMLSDLEILERHLERVEAQSKADPRAFAHEIALIQRAMQALGEGTPIRALGLEQDERAMLARADLLTNKPLLLVANVAEGDLPGGSELSRQVETYAEAHGAQSVVLSAAAEAELATWPAEDARSFREELGLPDAGLPRFVQSGYRLLDLITFFTTTGGKEVRAWTLQAGQTALEAAGAIHTDMARGFIRAEVVHYDDLDQAGSLAVARERGHLRLEGRDYAIQDGDVVHIRFNV